MKSGFVVLIAAVAAIGRPAVSVAQLASADVTLDVPVHLSKLSPDITKVAVTCDISSVAIMSTSGSTNTQGFRRQEVPVANGDVRTTVSLLFSFTGLNDPLGKTANVQCRLEGWNQRRSEWREFSDSDPDPAFRTSVTLSRITTSFPW